MRTGRKPVDQLAKAPTTTGRDAIWSTVRELKTFTVGEIARALAVHDKTVRAYLYGLEKSGRLSSVDPAKGDARVFTLINDTGPETPRVRADGTEVTQGRGTDQLWRTMKIMPFFDAATLARTASTTEHAVTAVQASDYIKMLCRAEYLALVRKSVSGRKPSKAAYRLVRNTGPCAPMIQRTPQIWDPNLQQVTWSEASS